MIEIKFKGEFTDLEGKPMEGILKGQVLATMLANATQGNAVKFFSWALSLYAAKPIQIDTSDFKLLRDFVEGQTTQSVLFKAQLLNDLDALKEASEKKQKKGE